MITSIENSEELASILNDRMVNRKGGSNQRLANMLGWRTKDNSHPVQANIPSEDRSQFAMEKYKFFLDAPFEISNKCCDEMKKNPLHTYSHKTRRMAITGEMAEESRLRTQKWIQHGCNMFDAKTPKSCPLSFWTENDVLQYIYENKLPICSVYGEVIKADTDMVGQMDIEDWGFGTGEESHCYKTTGCKRTGCALCAFGAHLDKQGEERFLMLKDTHPKMYRMLDLVSNNGVTFREAIEWTNEHGNLNIKL